MHDARHSERFSVAMGFQAGAVAGHDTIDFDATAAEEAQRIEEEADTRLAFFIGTDFTIGKARVCSRPTRASGDGLDRPRGFFDDLADLRLADDQRRR